MPPTTNTDLIRELGISLAMLAGRVQQLEMKHGDQRGALLKTDDSLIDARTRLAVAEARLADVKAAQEEKDRRRWAIWLAVVGSILTLIVNVALIAYKR